MAKYLCVRTCYVRPSEGMRPRLYEQDSIVSFEKQPEGSCFVAMTEKIEIDFETVSEEFLLSSDKWVKADLQDFTREKYNIDISSRTGRVKTVAKFVSARDNFIDLEKVNKTAFPNI